MEHKSDYIPISDPIVPLAGGDKSPQTPLQISPPKASKKPRTKSRSKRRDNHLSFRASDDEFEIIAERIARTGESQSDAVRAIIRESRDKAGNIFLEPKTPPEQLEALLGELQQWRKAFVIAKPRLNVATPAADDERHAQVVAWRKEADRLINEIPNLEIMVKLCINAITDMTPEKVVRLTNGLRSLATWKAQFIKSGKTDVVEFIQDLITLLENAGIKRKT